MIFYPIWYVHNPYIVPDVGVPKVTLHRGSSVFLEYKDKPVYANHIVLGLLFTNSGSFLKIHAVWCSDMRLKTGKFFDPGGLVHAETEWSIHSSDINSHITGHVYDLKGVIGSSGFCFVEWPALMSVRIDFRESMILVLHHKQEHRGMLKLYRTLFGMFVENKLQTLTLSESEREAVETLVPGFTI